MIPTIFTLLASAVGFWAFCKYILLVEIRVDSDIYKTLFDHFKNSNKFTLNEEFTSESRHPVLYIAFVFSDKTPWFLLSHSERLLQAGWHGKDHVTMIFCLRWNYKAIKQFLSHELKESSLKTLGIPVRILLPYSVDKIGSIKQKAPEPIMNRSLWGDIDDDIYEMLQGKRLKTGAILHGLPGNGKSSLVKYISTKYNLPIMIFTLNPEWSNHDLLIMFSNIPKKCIVLMEDFDNYFDKRQCIMGSSDKVGVKFTFDIFLNGLDGVYNTYENVVFIMTANDIEKIDDAIKQRPSRFKFLKHFHNPDMETRLKLLPQDWAKSTDGLNLDQIFKISELHRNGCEFELALQKIDRRQQIQPTVG
jgi:hypothetical protein